MGAACHDEVKRKRERPETFEPKTRIQRVAFSLPGAKTKLRQEIISLRHRVIKLPHSLPKLRRRVIKLRQPVAKLRQPVPELNDPVPKTKNRPKIAENTSKWSNPAFRGRLAP